MSNAVHCPRCNVALQEQSSHNADAQLLRRDTVANGGMCVECAVTQFIKSNPALMIGIRAHGECMLLAPHIQAGFAALLRAGNADATISEVNWSKVVGN